MSESHENEMLSALELLHYANRFRRERFTIVFAPEASFEKLELDLRLLQAAHIETIVIASDSDSLRTHINSAHSRGANICALSESVAQDPAELQKHLSRGTVPVLLLSGRENLVEFIAAHNVFSLSRSLGARKTIIISQYDGLTIGHQFLSHPKPEELIQALENRDPINIPTILLEYILDELHASQTEIILLAAEPGNLYHEIFTHRGRGTLFSHSYPNLIRRATLADTHQITLLLRPAMQDFSVLPLSENQIAEDIDNYSVYTVNGEIVALAKLSCYGRAVEIGKFATLPRYQGRGRARELARALIEQARQDSYEYIFALSTREKMWEFFENLGFKCVAREELPAEWASHYDFSRPSRAFKFVLNQ